MRLERRQGLPKLKVRRRRRRRREFIDNQQMGEGG